MTSDNMENKNFWSYLVAGIVIVVLLLYLFTFQVTAGQKAVVFRFGSQRAVKTDPGLYVKLPSPIETVRLLDSRVRLLDTNNKECQTKEKFNINFMMTIGWKITNPELFVKSLENYASAEQKILSQIYSARNKALSEFNFYDLVQAKFDKQQENFDAFEKKVLAIANEEILNLGWGIEISNLYVKNMSFPTEVSEKVFERMKAERENQAKDIRTRGESEAAIIKSEAKTKAEMKLAEAREKAEKLRGDAEAEAAKNYTVFRNNPELANFLRKLKALRAILAESKGTTVVLTTEETPFDLLKNDSTPSIGAVKSGK